MQDTTVITTENWGRNPSEPLPLYETLVTMWEFPNGHYRSTEIKRVKCLLIDLCGCCSANLCCMIPVVLKGARSVLPHCLLPPQSGTKEYTLTLFAVSINWWGARPVICVSGHLYQSLQICCRHSAGT